MGFDQETLAGEDCWLHGGDVGIFFQVGELWTWKTSDGTPAKHYTSQATKPLAVAKDAPVLAFTQDGRSLQFLDTSTGKVLQPVEGHRNPPSVLFRSDGSLISYDERKICLWTGGDWHCGSFIRVATTKDSATTSAPARISSFAPSEQRSKRGTWRAARSSRNGHSESIRISLSSCRTGRQWQQAIFTSFTSPKNRNTKSPNDCSSDSWMFP